MSSQFGHAFRISTFGESHGGGVGVVVDGCPPRLAAHRSRHPARPRPAPPGPERDRHPARGGRPRARSSPASSRAGPSARRSPSWSATRTRGPSAYGEMETAFRPSHADYTYQAKYGIRNWQGGGRASAPRDHRPRRRRGRRAEGPRRARARPRDPRLGEAQSTTSTAEVDPETVTFEQVEANIVRCPDAADGRADDRPHRGGAAARATRVGGVIECVVRGVPAGLGEPVFDKLEADLAKAMLSLPATKGFEIGSGFAGTRLTGSRAQRRLRHGSRQGPHHDQPLRRHPGRHQQRRGHRLPRRLQADRHHLASAADRDRPPARTPSSRPAAATTPACCPRAVPDGRGDGRAGARRPRAAPARAGGQSVRLRRYCGFRNSLASLDIFGATAVAATAAGGDATLPFDYRVKCGCGSRATWAPFTIVLIRVRGRRGPLMVSKFSKSCRAGASLVSCPGSASSPRAAESVGAAWVGFKPAGLVDADSIFDLRAPLSSAPGWCGIHKYLGRLSGRCHCRRQLRTGRARICLST